MIRARLRAIMLDARREVSLKNFYARRFFRSRARCASQDHVVEVTQIRRMLGRKSRQTVRRLSARLRHQVRWA